MRHIAAVSVLLIAWQPAQAAPDRATKRDLLGKVGRLGAMIRQNVESVEFDAVEFKAVTLADPADGGRTGDQALIVPFRLVGVDGGNVTQEYVALYRLVPQDSSFVRSLRLASGPSRKRVALVAFTQVNRHLWGAVDWVSASVNGGVLTADAHAFGCIKYRCRADERGTITVTANGSVFGPNLQVYDYPNPLYALDRCPLHEPASRAPAKPD